MGFYLHAYYWTQLSDLTWVPNVGCVDIEDWEIREHKLPTPRSELIVSVWCGAAEERPKWLYKLDGRPWMKREGDGRLRRVPAKPMLCSYTLEPRSRFCIVVNYSDECQRPNGPIVWYWDGSQIVDSRKKAAA